MSAVPFSASVGSVSRGLVFAGLAGVGFINGAAEKIANEIGTQGFAAAAVGTFGISVIVWFAFTAALALLMNSGSGKTDRLDVLIGLLCCAAFIMPVPHLSWVAITAIALLLRISSRSTVAERRAGAILLAATVPMLWSRAAFAVASTPLLTLDAKLVAWIAGTTSSGNTVNFANGGGVVFIQPACSSIANLSLAVVCGVLFVELRERRWTWAIGAWVAAAAAATVLVNITRIAMIALFPDRYDTIHGPIGVTIAQWTTLAAIVAILAFGTRAHEPSRP